MSGEPVVVWKVGGSLLNLPDLPAHLQAVLESNPCSLLIVGGGATAALVRRWDEQFHLGEEHSHQLALLAISLNENLLHRLMPASCLVSNRAEAHAAWQCGATAILTARRFLEEEESGGAEPLPHLWDVTSDSIAAWIASSWPAARLVLLKSCALPDSGDRDSLGPPIVDPCFRRLSRAIPEIGWINLRDRSHQPLRVQWL